MRKAWYLCAVMWRIRDFARQGISGCVSRSSGVKFFDELANVDKRHANRTRRALVSEKRLAGHAVRQFPKNGDLRQQLVANPLTPVIHRTRTTFPGRIMLLSGSGA